VGQLFFRSSKKYSLSPGVKKTKVEETPKTTEGSFGTNRCVYNVVIMAEPWPIERQRSHRLDISYAYEK